MKEERTRILTQFNLSPTAVKVYIALLELGKSSADKIAKKIGNYKANVYDALERLMEKGLASSIIEGNKKLYLPTNPEKLPQAIQEAKQEKIEEYEKLEESIQKIIPDLLVKYTSKKEKDLFEIYKGKQGYKAMIREIVKENPKYWKGFGNLQVQEYFPYEFQKWFKHVKLMLFSVKSELFSKRLKEAKRFTKVEIKFLPEEVYMQMVWTLFGDNLLILIYEPEIIALRIKSEPIVKTFSSQFDYLWKKHNDKKNR